MQSKTTLAFVVRVTVILGMALPLCAQYTQQGPQLVGSPVFSNPIGQTTQGLSVSLSADGNTAMVGSSDQVFDGATSVGAYVFTRSGGVWSQTAKLSGAAAFPTAFQAISVALSGDGATAALGGPLAIQTNTGVTTIYALSGGTWTPQAPQLIGTGAVGNAKRRVRSRSRTTATR